MFKQHDKWWDLLCILDLPNGTGTTTITTTTITTTTTTITTTTITTTTITTTIITTITTATTTTTTTITLYLLIRLQHYSRMNIKINY